MRTLDDPTAAACVLENSLLVLALPANEQIGMFAPHCVACGVRATFRYWQDEFADSPFFSSLTTTQLSALERVRKSSEAISTDPEFECSQNGYVRESSTMAKLRDSAADALAIFGWDIAAPRHSFVVGTSEFAARIDCLRQLRKAKLVAARRLESVTPRFHLKTFERFAHPLCQNRARISEIDGWEQRYGLKMPIALREWYEMEGPDLYEQLSTTDEATPLEELVPLHPALVCETGPSVSETFFDLWNTSSPFKLVKLLEEPCYLRFAVETNVGSQSLVRVDGSHDPPVFVLLPEIGPEPSLACPKFSEFVYRSLAEQ